MTTIKKTDVDLSHRLDGGAYCIDHVLDSSTLYNIICPMIERGISVLECLKAIIDVKRIDSLPDDALKHAIDTVINEFRDIDSTVSTHHNSIVAKKTPGL
ncbi:MAG: hypothetical protein Q8L79_07645 [Methylobacter sp.]|uniref:hypothetical protein n=1 Tax=Methylobacter sp. TaxID=2051955 RepID=UPI002731DFD9|nr:hypothetical protein [Methylobacter sp.]MDP1664986.1 hypothetical protein [Methylobacter sp.]